MTFTHPSADTSKIIKNFNQHGKMYNVLFLNKSGITYESTDANETNRLYEIMYNQALERDHIMNISELELRIIIDGLLSLLSVTIFFNSNYDTACILFFILLVLAIRDKIRKIEELKKYRIYLGMQEYLQNIDEESLNNYLSFVGISDELNINTLDNYSLEQIKRVRTNINRFPKKNEA